jgi:hypothetical protein
MRSAAQIVFRFMTVVETETSKGDCMLVKALTVVLLSAVLILTNHKVGTPINNSTVEAKAETVQVVAPEKVTATKQTPTEQQAVVTSDPQPIKVAPTTPKQIAQQKASALGWTGNEWSALEQLWHNESGWNPNAVNSSSGACGIPQALPCTKIPNPQSTESQIDWGLAYIKNRYGSPSKALAFWHHGAPKYNGSNWY